MKQQNIDVTQFEEELNSFKTGFARNYQLASDKFKKAIDEIDKNNRSSSKKQKKHYFLVKTI